MTTATSGLAVGVLLREGTRRLEAAAIPTARQDAEWLLATVLGLPRFDLYLEPAREVTAGGRDRFWALVGRRQAHEPLQYLLGFEDFVGLRIRVTPDVLIPRPETEGLVEWAVEILAPLDGPVAADVGTGSGAIACALAAACPALEVLAIDSSLAALAVAAGNVRAAGLSARVRLVAGDLLAPLASLAGGLDMIVSNPPYLPTGAIPSLPREVAGFEPRLALDGGPDGLRVIRRIVAEAPGLLRSGGTLLMEIGEEQAGLVASLMAAEGFSRIAARRDLRGVERFIAGQVGG
ncbi:MAG: peptide chain release factor N(5)-glutamine methyltransferase [candidate division NC10 bacterium]